MKKLFILLYLTLTCFANVFAITVTELDEAVADGTVITLQIGDQYLYGSTAQNCAMGDAAAALSDNNAVVGFKVEKGDAGYYFRAVTPAGGDYSLWGCSPCYLNCQPSTASDSVIFILGKDQDMTDGSAFVVEDDYALKCVGNDRYFNGVKTSSTPVEVSIITVEALKEIVGPEPEPEPIVIPESLKSFISNQTVFTLKSGDNYVYGPSQQNIAVGTWAEASSSENNANGYVLEADDNYYYLRAVKANGSDISVWGVNPCWLNNNGGNVVFNMGKDQDKENGSSWIFAEVADGKYTIESVNQPGKYLGVNGEAGTVSETATEWELYVDDNSNTEEEAAFATITVDDASFVTIQGENSGTVTAGTVAPDIYMIKPNTQEVGDYKLYQVKKNDEVIATASKDATYYMVELAAGDKIEVISQYPVPFYTVTFSDPSAVKSAGTVTQISGPVKCDAGYVFEYTLKDGYTANIASGFYLTQDTTITTEKLSNIIVAEGGTVGEISTITIKARKQGEMIMASGQDTYVITLVNKATRETVYSWDSEAITVAETVIDEETYMPVAVKLTVDPAITAAGTYDLVIPAGTFYVGEDMVDSDAAGTSFVIEGAATSMVEFFLPYRKNTPEVVKSVTHSGAAEPQITGWPTGMFEVANGYQMTIVLDEDNYQVDSLFVNYEKVTGADGVYITPTITENTSVDIYASEKAAPVLQTTYPQANTKVTEIPEYVTFMFDQEISTVMAAAINVGENDPINIDSEDISIIDGNTVKITISEDIKKQLPSNGGFTVYVLLTEDLVYDTYFTVGPEFAIESSEFTSKGGRLVFNENVDFVDTATEIQCNVTNATTSAIVTKATLTLDENDFVAINVSFDNDLNKGDYILTIPSGTIMSVSEEQFDGAQVPFSIGYGITIPDSCIAQGEVGTCIWYITENGTLVIAPADGVSGDLPEEGWTHVENDGELISVTTAPWGEYRDTIFAARIEPEVNAKSCRAMFYGLKNIMTIDLSNFNTQNVTNMSYMFMECYNLTSLDLSNFNTQNVTDMYGIFAFCPSLTSLDLSNFNTQNVTTMSGSFAYCSSLTSLDLSRFDTQNVTTMASMFASCSSLTSLDLSNFNTQNVTDMYGMFWGCSSLTSLNLSNFDTQNVTDMSYMFSECSNLSTIISNNETPSTLKAGTFDTFENRANCRLLVPIGSKELYAAADGWNELGKIMDDDDVAVELFGELATNVSEDENIATDDLEQLSLSYPNTLAGTQGYEDYVMSLNGDAKVTLIDDEGTTIEEAQAYEVDSVGTVEFTSKLKRGEEYSVIVPRGMYIINNNNKTYASPEDVLTYTTDYTLGDVDDDGNHSVVDIYGVASFIINGSEEIGWRVADCNKDDSVSITDISHLVEKIMTDKFPWESGYARQIAPVYAPQLSLTNNAGGLALSFDNAREFCSMQFDVTLTDNFGNNITSADAVKIKTSTGVQGHTVTTGMVDGKLRVLVFSIANKAFRSDDIVTIGVYANDMVNLAITNAELTSNSLNAVRINDTEAHLNVADGISEIGIMPQTVNIYDITGRKLNKANGRGIIIVNNKKIAK